MWAVSNEFGGSFSGSRKYYPRTNGRHFGLDAVWLDERGMNDSEGKPIRALETGKIVVLDYNGSGDEGKQIIIKTDDYFRSYQHLSIIRDGFYKLEVVERGDIIGYAGSTGNVTGAHLHTDKYFRYNAPEEEYIFCGYSGVNAYYVDPDVNLADI